MGFWSGLADFLTGRKRAADNASTERIRAAQDVMDSTITRLHAELEAVRADHQRSFDEMHYEVVDMGKALDECERDRVRLRVLLDQLVNNELSKEGDDDAAG